MISNMDLSNMDPAYLKTAAIDVDIAWAAGLFEGEGTIGISRARGRWEYPAVSLSSTDEDVVRRFREIVGVGPVNGPYMSRKSTKPYWRWSATGKGCRQVMGLLAPLLGERRTARWTEVMLSVQQAAR